VTFVRTARGHEALTHEDVTVSGKPLEVSNETAAELVKLGEKYDVEVLEFDTYADAAEGLALHRTVGVATADLSAGVAAITGTGDPVLSPEQPAEAPKTDKADAAPAVKPKPTATDVKDN
jgi:hypothetical protein